MQVAKWLGHSIYVLTMTTYADHIPEQEAENPRPEPVAAVPNTNVVQSNPAIDAPIEAVGAGSCQVITRDFCAPQPSCTSLLAASVAAVPPGGTECTIAELSIRLVRHKTAESTETCTTATVSLSRVQTGAVSSLPSELCHFSHPA
jgi:hypothetical protein